MATRGIIRFAKREEGVSFNEHPEKVHTQIYHHYDSYPEHLGIGLARFLSDTRVVNGLNNNDKVANGMGDLVAQVITHLKLGRHYDLGDTRDSAPSKDTIKPGNIYVDPFAIPRLDTEYTYYVWADYNKSIWMSIFSGGLGHNPDCEFVGKPEKLLEKYDKERN